MPRSPSDRGRVVTRVAVRIVSVIRDDVAPVERDRIFGLLTSAHVNDADGAAAVLTLRSARRCTSVLLERKGDTIVTASIAPAARRPAGEN